MSFKNNPQFPFSELRLGVQGRLRGVARDPGSVRHLHLDRPALTPWSAPDTGAGRSRAVSDSFEIKRRVCLWLHPGVLGRHREQPGGRLLPVHPLPLKAGRRTGIGWPDGQPPAGPDRQDRGRRRVLRAQVAAARRAATPVKARPSSPARPARNPPCSAPSRRPRAPGPTPYSVTGKAYLTGPYRGAPYGVAVIVPAVAGPFDLGVVVIRQALYINPSERMSPMSQTRSQRSGTGSRCGIQRSP